MVLRGVHPHHCFRRCERINDSVYEILITFKFTFADVDHNGQRGATPPPTSLQQQQQQHHQHNQQKQHQDNLHGIRPQSGGGGSGSNSGPQIYLSELPEPPIPVSEIGPIPPPAMFSTPSPTAMSTVRTHAGVIQQLQQQQNHLQQQQQQIPQQPPPSYGAHLNGGNGIVGIHNPQVDEYDYEGKSRRAH